MKREQELKNKVIELRRAGKTYGEIRKIVGGISKSTLSCWCGNIKLSKKEKERIGVIVRNKLVRARKLAMEVNKNKRQDYLKSVGDRNRHLADVIKNKDTAKIALAMLYACEGSKNKRGSLVFGNSDPIIVGLFLSLLRSCYKIDEAKFRCTLQGRADQNVQELEKFWSKVTGISLKQFYKAQIDKRSIGKPTKKLNYKGVCRIDFFSGDIFQELKSIVEIINSGI